MKTEREINADVAIIGGGLVGCAVAHHLATTSDIERIVVLEKEASLAAHQSGRNSGVIHSGIYYRPGSQKAENCRVGRERLIEFCEDEKLDYDICGKVIVATSEEESLILRGIRERGIENGIENQTLDAAQLKEIEPSVRGVEALYVPTAGIVDFRAVCLRLGEKIEQYGHRVIRGMAVKEIDSTADGITIKASGLRVNARIAVNCAGLQADRVARMAGQHVDFQIVPFRGIYYELIPAARHYCRNLIYPVPDPSFPFLGVHFTRTIDGRIECGPNAVLASGREAYDIRSTSASDLMEILNYSGFRTLARKHWRKGMDEVARSVSTRRYVRELRRLIPSLSQREVVRTRSGIRAQALDSDGQLIEDFVIQETGSMISVCNAPSPAATACLRIGETIADRVTGRIG